MLWWIFLSTLSLRRATDQGASNQTAQQISIHALLAESDACIMTITICTALFLSTLSLRRATDVACGDRHKLCHFYPRSPCGERLQPKHRYYNSGHFYPRSPCGERHIIPIGVGVTAPISIHALLAESDRFLPFGPMTRPYFYPRSPFGERRLWVLMGDLSYDNFYPRSPCGERPIMDNVIFVPGQFLSTLSLRRAT